MVKWKFAPIQNTGTILNNGNNLTHWENPYQGMEDNNCSCDGYCNCSNTYNSQNQGLQPHTTKKLTLYNRQGFTRGFNATKVVPTNDQFGDESPCGDPCDVIICPCDDGGTGNGDSGTGGGGPDGGPGAGGAVGDAGGGDQGGGNFGGSDVNYPPPPYGPINTNYYDIQVDKNCTCLSIVNNALERLYLELTSVKSDSKVNTLRKLIFCAGQNDYLRKLIECLLNNTGCLKKIKSINCDPTAIGPTRKDHPNSPFFWRGNPTIKAGTIYADCSQVLMLLENHGIEALESALFHEFIHICEDCIFNFDASKHSEVDAYILQNYLFPNMSFFYPNQSGKTYQTALQQSNMILGGQAPEKNGFLYGNFFVLDTVNGKFYLRTDRNDPCAHTTDPCGYTTYVFTTSTRKIWNPPLVTNKGTGADIYQSPINPFTHTIVGNTNSQSGFISLVNQF